MADSKIKKITDALALLVTSTLDSSYVRIPNPYSVQNNAETWLEKGFGIGVGPGVRQDREICNAYYQRNFSIVLTRLVHATSNDTNERANLDLTILEDFQELFLAIEKEKNLGGLTIDCRVDSDSGIQFTDADRFKFMTFTIDLTVDYQEQY